MNLNIEVHCHARWHWDLLKIGFTMSAHVGGKHAPRWFRIQAGLLFLWLELCITSKNDPGETVGDE